MRVIESVTSHTKEGYVPVNSSHHAWRETEDIYETLSKKFPNLLFPFIKEDHIYGVKSDVHVLCKEHGILTRVGLAGMLYDQTKYACMWCALSNGAKHRALAGKHYSPNAFSRLGLQTGIFMAVKKEFPDAQWEVTMHNGQELDIYVPSIKCAVELNGNYWHSEHMGRGPSYHLGKSIFAAHYGIAVIHIWEEEAVAPYTNIINILKLVRDQPEFHRKKSDRLEFVEEEAAKEFYRAWGTNHGYGAEGERVHLAYIRRGSIKACVSYDKSIGLATYGTTSVTQIDLNEMLTCLARTYGFPYGKMIVDLRCPHEAGWAKVYLKPVKQTPPIPWQLDSGNGISVLSGKPATQHRVWDCGHGVYMTH